MKTKKKLIEVALPLSEINKFASKEKSIRKGHPSTLHLWWARRPLAVCRAVLLAQIIDDPSANTTKFPTAAAQDSERNRLLKMIAQSAEWSSTKSAEFMTSIRQSVKDSGGEEIVVFDPFSGGGSIPLEANRLSLESVANDLNPVACLITKSTASLGAKYWNAKSRHKRNENNLSKGGYSSLAADVFEYAKDFCDLVSTKCGALYPNISARSVGTAIGLNAVIWIRTIESPNPAFRGIRVPLLRQNYIVTKEGNRAWVKVRYNPTTQQVELNLESEALGHTPPPLEKYSEGLNFKDFTSGEIIDVSYIRAAARDGRLGFLPIALIGSHRHRRIYLPVETNSVPVPPASQFLMDIPAPAISGYFNPPLWGHTTFGSLYNDRQRYVLEQFVETAREFFKRIESEIEDKDYADLVATYLTLGIGRLANRYTCFNTWDAGAEQINQTFIEQGVPMVWDYAEVNPFSNFSGSYMTGVEYISKVIEELPLGNSSVINGDAAKAQINTAKKILVSTDPPYFSSITYADFADFFYLIFRPALGDRLPQLFSTIACPKTDEAVAAWHRFGGNKQQAADHFTNKLSEAIRHSAQISSPEFPFVIYYAFKSTELSDAGITAWESILSTILRAGLQVVRTWPLRTERTTGRKALKNFLASSIIIVCRKAPEDKPEISLRDFISELRDEMKTAIAELMGQSLSPADLPQSLVGPGMSVYSRYKSVVKPDGSQLAIGGAIELVHQISDEIIGENLAAYDLETQWALLWLKMYSFDEGPFDDAEKIAQAKALDLNKLSRKNMITSRAAKVRLTKREQIDDSLIEDSENLNIWLATNLCISALLGGSVLDAAKLLASTPYEISLVKDLAYQCFQICDKNSLATEANDYNALVQSWPEIVEAINSVPKEEQQNLKLD